MELSTEAQFRREPLGKSTAGTSWLYFHPSTRLAGFVLFGEPATDDVARLVRVLEAMLGKPPHVTLVDVKAVRGGEPAGFKLLGRYIRDHGGQLGGSMTKLAIVRRRGFLGALAAGFFGIEEPPCPVKLFDDRKKALAWLGIEASFEEVLEDHLARATATSTLLRDLQTTLERAPTISSVAEAARALHVSTRTLQRRLKEDKTSFSREIAAARVRAAQRLLLSEDTKLTRIAQDVGCASSSHLSALFRKVTGMPPLAWRRAELTRAKRS